LIGAGDDRSDFLSFDIRDEIREHCRVGNRAAEQLQVLQIAAPPGPVATMWPQTSAP
jgi:hypothetical protein